MKIIIYSRPNAGHTTERLNTLLSAFECLRIEYKVNAPFAEVIEELTDIKVPQEQRYDNFEPGCCNADMAVSYGGDGTFLECAKFLGTQKLPILGINQGRLGFLASVAEDSIFQTFDDIAKGHYTVEESTLLEVEGDFEQTPEYPFAFNEISIQRGGLGMISVEARINGEMIASYWGDGVLLSTPAGSTAYMLSVGGPIVAPACSCFVIAPIAPHNLNLRPVVIPDSSEVELKVYSRDQFVTIGLDSEAYKAEDGARFIVRKAKTSTFLVRLQNISFYDTLRNKMMWGFDRRDQKRDKQGQL